MEAGAQVEDIMLRQDFAVGNAAITAEGALGLLISGSDKTLWRRKALILGWGRIGSILAQRLRAMGADVYAAARKSRDRAMARAMGCHGLGFDELEGRVADFDYIINTIPRASSATPRSAASAMTRCCWSLPRSLAASTGIWPRTSG